MHSMRALGLFLAAIVLVGASVAVPLSHLSLDERRHSLPGSTMVTIGNKKVSLAALRHAHEAREEFVGKASATGRAVKHTLQSHTIAVRTPIKPILPTATPSSAPFKSYVGGHPVILTSPSPPSLKLTGIGKAFANIVLEPPSLYGSAPADMKAFCQRAWAAACVFLPPQQPAIQTSQGQLLATDTLIDQNQCSSEGGHWGNYYNGVTGCGFLYPNSVTVHFTPGANYKLSSSAQCDSSWWTYSVDPHGAVTIGLAYQVITNLAMVGVWGYAGPSTGSSPWCVVYVTKG